MTWLRLYPGNDGRDPLNTTRRRPVQTCPLPPSSSGALINYPQPPGPILILDECRSVLKIGLLPVIIEGKEAPRHHAWTDGSHAFAVRNIGIVKRIEPIVDCDFLPLGNVSPCENSNTSPHGVRVARVIQVAARRKEDCTRFKIEFT
jgi:hypothetical protein